MSLDPITAVFDLGKTAIEKIWPDANTRAEEMRKLEELRQQGDLARMNSHVQLLVAQVKVNEVSASHPSLFVAGARPAVIWAGVAALVYSGLIYPLMTWGWAIAQAHGAISNDMMPPPYVESDVLGTIVAGLLGVGGMRSYDKKNGTQTNNVKGKGTE